MPKPILINYTPTMDDFMCMNQEYMKTSPGRKRKQIGIAVGIFTCLVFTFLYALSVNIFPGSEPTFLLKVDHFVVPKTILSTWLICLFPLVITFLLIGKLSVARYSNNSYNQYPINRTTRNLEFHESYIHENNQYFENWVALDKIEKVIITRNHHFLFYVDNPYRIVIPNKCIDKSLDSYLNHIVERISKRSIPSGRNPIEPVCSFEPESVGIKYRLIHQTDVRDVLWSSIEQSIKLPKNFSGLKKLILILMLIVLLLLFLLYLTDPTQKELFQPILSIGIFILVLQVIMFLFNIFSRLLFFLWKRENQETIYTFDEAGTFIGNDSMNIYIKWAHVLKILKTRHNVFLILNQAGEPRSIPIKDLDDAGRHTLDTLLAKIVHDNPNVKLNNSPARVL